MKRVLWMMVTIVVSITSCAKNSEPADSLIMHSEDFTAILGNDTRTTLDGTSVKWCKEDLLTIFTKTSHNRKYDISELSDDRSSATFSYVSYTGTSDTPITSNYALYPYDADATISGDVITTTIATEQNYVKTGNNNLSYALMVAKSDNTTFTFSNTSALIRFKISKVIPDTYTLQSITLTSAANKLSGEVTIDTSADCKAVVSSSGSNSVTLTNIGTTIPDTGLSFYVALPATSFEAEDLTATITFSEGTKVFVLHAFELTQGKIKTISYSISDADDFTGNIPGDGSGDDTPIIEPKPANNEIWYTAATAVDPHYINFGATIISNTYDEENNRYVIKFDGDVKYIGYKAFYYCEELTSITMPNSVTSIGQKAFYLCGLLKSINIPDGITSIEEDTFLGCALQSVTIPDSVTSIRDSAFQSCDNLTSVTIPDSVTSIGDSAFSGCSSLTSVTIGDHVTSIGNRAFLNCTDLKTVNCRSTRPSLLGEYVFYNSKYNPNTSKYKYTFIGSGLYVPASDDDSIINAYKASNGWSSYKDYIYESASM